MAELWLPDPTPNHSPLAKIPPKKKTSSQPFKGTQLEDFAIPEGISLKVSGTLSLSFPLSLSPPPSSPSLTVVHPRSKDMIRKNLFPWQKRGLLTALQLMVWQLVAGG